MDRKGPPKKIEIRTHCPECGYRHQKGRTAGFFVRIGFNGGRYDEDVDDVSAGDLADEQETEPTIEEGTGGEDEERKAQQNVGVDIKNKDDDEDDESRLHRPMTAKERRADALLRKELGPSARRLNTPNFVRSIGYVRCNCITGVPSDVLGWLPVKCPRFVGGIRVNPKDLDDDPSWPEIGPPPAEVLDLVMPFLDGRSAGRSCLVSPEWNVLGRKVPRYVDLLRLRREEAAVATFRAHEDVVEDLLPYGDFLFTAGDRVVKCWQPEYTHGVAVPESEGGSSEMPEGVDWAPHGYEQVSTLVQDTTAITTLLLSYNDDGNSLLYTASRNGYIRQWTIHNSSPPSSKTILSKATSEHQRQVNSMVACHPTVWDDYCQHGLWNHQSCRFFTGSDDRSVRVWDSLTGEHLDCIDVPCRRSCTIKSLEVSDRHLFAGTSAGTILVYPLGERICERDDTHLCTETPNQRWCLQAELNHGEEDNVIRALMIGGPCYAAEYLFSGGDDGTVAVFRLPTSESENEPGAGPGLGRLDFRLMATLRGHKLGVACMAATWSHLYTGSDDGTVRMWELSTISVPFCFQRSLDTGHPMGVGVRCIRYVEKEEEGQRQGGWGASAAGNGFDGVHSWQDSNADGGGEVAGRHERYRARYLFLGLASGEVQKWRLGDWV